MKHPVGDGITFQGSGLPRARYLKVSTRHGSANATVSCRVSRAQRPPVGVGGRQFSRKIPFVDRVLVACAWPQVRR